MKRLDDRSISLSSVQNTPFARFANLQNFYEILSFAFTRACCTMSRTKIKKPHRRCIMRKKTIFLLLILTLAAASRMVPLYLFAKEARTGIFDEVSVSQLVVAPLLCALLGVAPGDACRIGGQTARRRAVSQLPSVSGRPAGVCSSGKAQLPSGHGVMVTQSGFFDGTPAFRGYSGGVSAVFSMTSNARFRSKPVRDASLSSIVPPPRIRSAFSA